MSAQTIIRMQKKQFRIGECAKHLKVERFVIRFWEKEFNLKTDRSTGGQRFYSNEDVVLFEEIKKLLYQKGFTIAGAKKHIAQNRSLAAPQFKQKTEIYSTETYPTETYSSAQKQTYTQEQEQTKKTELALLEENKKLTMEKEELKSQLLHLNKQLHKLQNLL